jgi:hypothetical protein
MAAENLRPVIKLSSHFRIQINDDEIFVYENSLIGIVVQFNMEKILSIQVPTYHKNKMCGVCALNNNLDLKYTMN